MEAKKEPRELPRKKERSPDCPPAISGEKATYGAYYYQPVTQPDSRFPETRVACPDDDHVEQNREWIQENKL